MEGGHLVLPILVAGVRLVDPENELEAQSM